MTKTRGLLISVVVPLYNEVGGLNAFHKSLVASVQGIAKDDYEIIYCDDGSTDDTAELIRQFRATNPRVRLIKLSRNFGKESALAAGIAAASGQAIITLDGDGQHPVELLPDFVRAWRNGAQVVVGVRTANRGEGLIKRFGSRLFHTSFNMVAGTTLVPGSSDYRLIDRAVQLAFLQLTETDRVTRGLIDWLGFRREFILFSANPRQQDTAGYSPRKLVTLATNSFVSLSVVPLYLFGWLGILITTGAFLVGGAVIIEQLLLGDPWHWKFTGTAMLSIMLLFLVGIVLLSQGMLSLYVSHIHSQSRERPLYVIDYAGSAGIVEENTRHAS